MVHIEMSEEYFVVQTDDGRAVWLPRAEAAQVFGALIEHLGSPGHGYAQGVADGVRLGYQQRDREYVADHAKRFRRAQRAALAAAAQKVEAA